MLTTLHMARLYATTACYAAVLVLSCVSLPAASVAGQAAAATSAQSYPTRPIRIVAPNSPGSGADVVARLVAIKLTEAWGQQVVIDNRAGASGNIGSEIVARATPDGYTLLMITSQQAINAAMFEKLNYDHASTACSRPMPGGVPRSCRVRRTNQVNGPTHTHRRA